jgi:hypothetical protein
MHVLFGFRAEYRYLRPENSENGGISVASPMLGGKMTQSSAKRPKAAESGARAADQKDRLSDIADDTLGFLTDIAAAANAKLGEARSGGPESFAVVNTLTGANAVQNISDISAEQRKQLVDLSREPAIARLVLRDEAGEETVYFIARAGTLSKRTSCHGKLPLAHRANGITAGWRGSGGPDIQRYA